MANPFSREAEERARWTVQAVEAMCREAETIAQTCARAQNDAIIVAAVEADTSFSGAWAIPHTEMREHILQLEDSEGKYVVAFAPLSSVDVIEKHCKVIAHLAERREQAIRRWRDAHS